MYAGKLMLIVLVSCLLKTNSGKATNFYFSNSTGDDTREFSQAQNKKTPWKSLRKLNELLPDLRPGDTIFFKRGDEFYGEIKITRSGTTKLPVVFTAYGVGEKPILKGLIQLNNWEKISDNIWKSKCSECPASVNNLLINNQPQIIARYPNKNDDNGGYLILQSNSGNWEISDPNFLSLGNLNEAEIVIRKNPWIIDRNKIRYQWNNSIVYTTASNYKPSVGYGYFIQNTPSALDVNGEWYFNPKSNELLIFLTNNPNVYSIEVSSVNTLLSCLNVTNIKINNICFNGAGMNAFVIKGTQHVEVSNCVFLNSGTNAITGSNNDDLRIVNNDFYNTNNNGIYLNANCSNTVVRNNKIRNTGMNPGMGKSGDDSYQAIIIRGNNNKLELNNIDSTGYSGIRFEGDSALIKNNFIANFCLVKDDGGGIYTWTDNEKISGKGSKLIENVIINGTGARNGTPSLTGLAYGIYLDNNTGYVEVTRNSITNCSRSGIFLHNNNHIAVYNNTLYNNGNQLEIYQEGECTSCSVSSNRVNGNILFSKFPDQFPLEIKQPNFNTKELGSFNNNFYGNAFGHNYIVSLADSKTTSTAYDLLDWQLDYAKDAMSKTFSANLSYYSVDKLLNDNKVLNGKFDSNLNGLYCYSSLKNTIALWNQNNKMNGGSLQIVSNSAINEHSYVIIGVGEVKAGQKYVLNFSVLSTKKKRVAGVFLRQSVSPYMSLTPGSFFNLTDTRTANEILFAPVKSEANASIVFELIDKDCPIWFDDISLKEANVTITDPDNFIRYEYNPTAFTKTIQLSDVYADVKDKLYSGKLKLKAFSSIILIKKKVQGETKREVDRAIELSVYPNPSTEFLNVKINNTDSKQAVVEIFDTFGRLIILKNINPSDTENVFRLDTSALHSGLYLLKINIGRNTYQGKFMKSL